MGLIKIDDDLDSTFDFIMQAYQQFQDGQIQQAVQTVMSSNVGSGFIIYAILPLVISLVGIIFSFISCCYMCCCNSAKKYRNKQRQIDKEIIQATEICQIQTKKGDDVYGILKSDKNALSLYQKIETDMQSVRSNEYRKVKKCMWWQWTCTILYAILSVIYCVGLILMEVSVGKVGGALPQEKDMLDEKVTTLMNLGDSYTEVLDGSLSTLQLTNTSLFQQLFKQQDQQQLNNTIDQFFQDIRNLQLANNFVQDLRELYSNQDNQDLSTTLRSILYYQQYNDNDSKPEFIQQGQHGIDEITSSLQYINGTLDDLNEEKNTLTDTLNQLSNIVNVDLSSIDLPTFDDILQQIGNQTIQNVVTELMNDQTDDRLQRVMLQIKELLNGTIPYEFLLDELIPWTSNNGIIQPTEKQDIIQIINDQAGINLENVTEFMSQYITDDVVNQGKDILVQANNYIKDIKYFSTLSFNEFFNQLVNSSCSYLWCGLIDEQQYNSFVNTVSSLPLLKMDASNPQSIVTSVTLIIGLLVSIIPIIYIIFVLISQCCGWRCCSCFTMSFMPLCGAFSILTIPQATIVPITNTLTTDIDELSVQAGQIVQELDLIENPQQTLLFDLDVQPYNQYVTFSQDNQQVDVIQFNFTSFNISEALQQFDYTVQITYNLEDTTLSTGEQLMDDILDIFPEIKQYTNTLNNIIDSFAQTPISLDMEQSNINQLFSENRQAIIDLIKFGGQNVQNLVDQFLDQGLNYTFDQNLNNSDGIKNFLTVDYDNLNGTAQTIQNEVLPMDSISGMLDNINLASMQCQIDDADQMVNKAYGMTTGQKQNITLFDDITTILNTPEGDIAEIKNQIQSITNNLDNIIDSNDIFNNQVKTLEDIISNVYYEYIQAQNISWNDKFNGQTPSNGIYNGNETLRNEWKQLPLDSQVQTSDLLYLNGFEEFLKMQDDTMIPKSNCVKAEQVAQVQLVITNLGGNYTEADSLLQDQNEDNDTYSQRIDQWLDQSSISEENKPAMKVAIQQLNTLMQSFIEPKWWSSILEQRQLIIDNQLWRYNLLGSYCSYINELNNQFDTILNVTNVTSQQQLQQFIFTLEDNIKSINNQWASLQNIIIDVGHRLFNQDYECIDGQGYAKPADQNEYEEPVKDYIDDWISYIFISVINNIGEAFKNEQQSTMPLIKKILIESQLYTDIPKLVYDLLDQTLLQVCDQDSIINTQILNTAVTTLTDQIVILSDPFNYMAIGVYLCLLFCILAPFAACCSYRQLYLRGFEKDRQKQLGVKDPHANQQDSQRNKVDVSTVQPVPAVQINRDQRYIPEQQPPQYYQVAEQTIVTDITSVEQFNEYNF